MANKETVGGHLLTMHNVHFLLNLMGRVRKAIVEDRYPKFLREWLGRYYGVDEGGKEKWPGWVIEALSTVGVELLD